MDKFPALYMAGTEQLTPARAEPGGIEVGRSHAAHVRVRDLTCSRRQFRIVLSENRYYVENLSESNPTLLNGSKVAAPVALSHGDRIRAGKTAFVFAERPDPALGIPTASGAAPAPAAAPEAPPGRGAPRTAAPRRQPATRGEPPAREPKPGAPPPVLHTMVGAASEAERVQVQGFQGEVPLEYGAILGREEGPGKLFLPHPLVSRMHAQITPHGGRFVLSDLMSANGTFVNGERIKRPRDLRPGDRIDIGPFTLTFTGRSLTFSSSEANLKLVATGLSRQVKDRASGKQILILDDVSLVVEPNEFVVLLGPSGSGKSTLMNALSARVPATSGQVSLNGKDLYRNFEALKRNLALVPQRDVVHSQLTPQQAFCYTARLRLPPDTSRQEIQQAIGDTLDTLGLTERRDTRIAFLSGGQVKRVSLGNEIIARPSLLFLDEVTSGLDEQTDREMMACFRKVADTGKTVVCITHSLANVDRFCDLVVFLATGGTLAFYGHPSEALAFFGVPRLGDVYDKMGEKRPEEWQGLYRQSPWYAKYVTNRMPGETQAPQPAEATRAKPWSQQAMQALRQLGLLARRYARIMAVDRGSLAFAFGQALVVALMLWIFFGDLDRHDDQNRATESAKLLFLLATSCIWIGCNNAAKEIVKERGIYRRERDVNLLVPSYYFSKVLVLGFLGVLQTCLIFFLVAPACRLEGSWALQWLVLNVVTLSGMTLGLLISASSRSPDMAVTIIPIVLIPQVIFAGMIAPLEGAAKWLARLLVANYWAYDALKTTLPDSMTSLKHPFTSKLLLGESGSLLGSSAALCWLTLLGVGLALLALRLQDIKATA